MTFLKFDLTKAANQMTILDLLAGSGWEVIGFSQGEFAVGLDRGGATYGHIHSETYAWQLRRGTKN